MGDTFANIITILIAIFAIYFAEWLRLRNERKNIIDATLNEIVHNLLHGKSIITALNSQDVPLMKFKTNYDIEIKKFFNIKKIAHISIAYYQLDFTNEFIDEYNQSIFEEKNTKMVLAREQIKTNILDKKNGLIVLLQIAKEEINNIKKDYHYN